MCRVHKQQHKMIKVFPPIPFRSFALQSGGGAVNHLIVFIRKSILMFHFCGKRTLASIDARSNIQMEALLRLRANALQRVQSRLVVVIKKV